MLVCLYLYTRSSHIYTYSQLPGRSDAWRVPLAACSQQAWHIVESTVPLLGTLSAGNCLIQQYPDKVPVQPLCPWLEDRMSVQRPQLNALCTPVD